MIESPLLNELIAEKVAEERQQALLNFLEARFGPVSVDLAHQVKGVTKADRLKQLTKQAAICSDLESFQQDLGV